MLVYSHIFRKKTGELLRFNFKCLSSHEVAVFNY